MKCSVRLGAVIFSIFTAGIFSIWWWFGREFEWEESLGVTHTYHTKSDVKHGEDGWVKCDPVALTCLFGNLFYFPGEGFTVYVRDWTSVVRWSGSFMQPGIGSPSEYFYLDTWTFSPEGAVPLEVKEDALRRIEQERTWTPDREMKPVHVKPISDFQPSLQFATMEEASIIFSVLWPKNFFRSLYAGAVALFSLYEWNAVAPSSASRINVALLDSALPSQGHHNLFQSFYPSRPLLMVEEETRVVRFKIAVMGLSRNAILGEVEFAYPTAGHSLMSAAYRCFSNIVRKWMQDNPASASASASTSALASVSTSASALALASASTSAFPFFKNSTLGNDLKLLSVQGSSLSTRVVLVLRRDSYRRILNLNSVLSMIRQYPVSIKVVAFEDHPVKEQIRIAAQADILIAVHGAALSHIMFMKSGATVIELFPYGFRKRIYQNLANTLGVQYAVWQCPRESCSRPNLPGTGESKVDWSSQASKEFWRNQDIIVDIYEVGRIFDFILDGIRPRTVGSTPSLTARNKGEKFLMYLPWEQFNNQLVGFKSACAVASFLNRTLVIPPIGFRKPLPPDLHAKLVNTVRVFSPREFEWRSFTRYFNPLSLKSLPCRTVAFDTFTSVTKRVGVLLLRRLGQSVRVIPQQMGDYFHYIANLEYEKIAALPVYFPLYFERPDIDRFLHRYDRDRVLCLGTMFWMYSFSGPLDFPVRSYQDKMHDPLYYRITTAMRYHPDLTKLVSGLQLGIYNAVHLRRGDYAQKCYDEGMGASQETVVLRACYQTPGYLIQRIRKIQKQQKRRDMPWFLATNDPNLGRLRDILKKLGIHTIILSDLENVADLDPIETSIVDQLLCANAKEFIGNYFSSFTRTIVEQRQLRGRGSSFF